MCAAIITSVSHADVLSLSQEPGGILGSIRNEKAALSTGKNSGERALPGITGMSRTFWLARVLLVIAGVKGKAQISKPSLPSLHFPPADREPPPRCVLTGFMPQLLQELYPNSLWSHFTSLELLPRQPVFYQIENAVPDSSDLLQMFCFPSSNPPLHSSTFELIHPDLKKPDMVSDSIFLSLFTEISLLIDPRIAFALLCLTSQSGCSHPDHTVLDHLLLIISYIISQTVTSAHIPDLSSQTFSLPSHFNYSDSQGHLVLSDLYSHSSLRCQNFHFCVLGDFSLRILLSLPRSSTRRKDQFPNCSVRKSFGKFPPENCTSPYSLLILLSFSFTNNFPHGTYQIPDWSLDKGDQQHFLCLENQVSYQNKAIMFVWHNLHFVNPCCILSHFPFISACLIVLPFKIHFEISSQG